MEQRRSNHPVRRFAGTSMMRIVYYVSAVWFGFFSSFGWVRVAKFEDPERMGFWGSALLALVFLTPFYRPYLLDHSDNWSARGRTVTMSLHPYPGKSGIRVKSKHPESRVSR